LLSLHPEQVDRGLKKLETAQLIRVQPAILQKLVQVKILRISKHNKFQAANAWTLKLKPIGALLYSRAGRGQSKFANTNNQQLTSNN
jgi:small ligand-binding sensory domain FIST